MCVLISFKHHYNYSDFALYMITLASSNMSQRMRHPFKNNKVYKKLDSRYSGMLIKFKSKYCNVYDAR